MAPVQISMAGISVMLAMPCHRDLPVETVRSLMETQALFQAKGVGLDIQFQVGSSLVVAARSKIANEFLKSANTRLFWVDSDIKWNASDFWKLTALSAKMDVVGALYPAKRDPLLFFVDVDDKGSVASNEYGCLPLRGYGLGFTCVHRTVIEELAEKAPKLRFPDSPEPIPHIFRTDELNGLFRGEDMAFFADIRATGRQVWADPTITLGHVGAKTYSGALMDHLALVTEGASSHG